MTATPQNPAQPLQDDAPVVSVVSALEAIYDLSWAPAWLCRVLYDYTISAPSYFVSLCRTCLYVAYRSPYVIGQYSIPPIGC